MAKKEHISETQATQLLRKHQVSFDEHPYPYEEHGGTSVSARELNVPEHAVRISLNTMDSRKFRVLRGLQRSSSESISDEVFDSRFGSFCPHFVTGYWPQNRQYCWDR
ncbi:hypothetical protein ACWYXJ_22500 [Janthinobacterium lividum]